MKIQAKVASRILDSLKGTKGIGLVQIGPDAKNEAPRNRLIEAAQLVIETIDACFGGIIRAPWYDVKGLKNSFWLTFKSDKLVSGYLYLSVFEDIVYVYKEWRSSLHKVYPDAFFTLTAGGLRELAKYAQFCTINLDLRLKNALRQLDRYRSLTSTLHYERNGRVTVVNPTVKEESLQYACDICTYVVMNLRHIAMDALATTNGVDSKVQLAFAVKDTTYVIYYITLDRDTIYFYDSRFQYRTESKVQEKSFPATMQGLESLRFHILERVRLISDIERNQLGQGDNNSVD